MDTIIIGGQPNWLSDIINPADGLPFHWSNTGREINSDVDAEKTLDLTPSVPHRAPSVCSGEYGYYARDYGALRERPRGVAGMVHNLWDVAAKVRAVTATADVFGYVQPDSTVGSSNAQDNAAGAAGFADVDNDPYSSTPPATYVEATDVTLPWTLEVGFSNAAALSTVAGAQQIIVYLTSIDSSLSTQDTPTITIEVKEGGNLRGSKTLRIRNPASGSTFITSVLVSVNDFTDPTLDGMSVLVTVNGFPNAFTGSWRINAIGWIRSLSAGVENDTGWVSVEDSSVELHRVGESQLSSVIAYLDNNGEVDAQVGRYSYFMFYWDDSIDVQLAGRSTIFADFDTSTSAAKSGALTSWRPEVGEIVEGPAYGTGELSFGYQVSWVDPSVAVTTPGGNRWVQQLPPYRQLTVNIHEVPDDEAAQDFIALMRRSGQAKPFLVCLKTGSDDITETVSMYAYVSSFSATSTRKDTNGEWFEIALTFTEVL